MDLTDDNANPATAEVANEKQPAAACTKKQARASKGRRKSTDSEDEDEDESVQLKKYCRICVDKFRPNERFKICIECNGRAHVNCVRTTDDVFMCRDCFSDMEKDDSDSE